MQDQKMCDIVVDFFNENYTENKYAYEYQRIDDTLLKFIQETAGKKFLDIGGGNGSFAVSLLAKCPSIGDVTVVDPSEKFLNSVKRDNIHKIVGHLPDQLNIEYSFDYISCNWVFHHVVGRTISNSKNNLIDSLDCIKPHLDNSGYLIINEVYYDGYIYDKLPRSIIFYILKIQNRLKLRIPLRWFIMDLLVCFYTRNELKHVLDESDFKVVLSKESPWKVPILFRLAGLKEFGNILIISKLKQ